MVILKTRSLWSNSKTKVPYGLWFYLSMYDAFTAAAGRVPLEMWVIWNLCLRLTG